MKQRVVKVQPVDWDKVYEYDISNFDIHVGDVVVVETQLGISITNVLELKEQEMRPTTAMIPKIKRKATEADAMKFAKQASKREEVMLTCKQVIRRLSLPMKLLDVFISIDDKRFTFAFVADGRVDFRELVKSLAQSFQKSIRLQQIGVRDETEIGSDIGACGQQTCCTRFLGELGNVNASYAEVQEVSHRGADRLSGICGRLACCLKYEQGMYEDLSKKFPAIGARILTKAGLKAKVIGYHLLRGAIKIKIEGQEAWSEIELNEVAKTLHYKK